MSSTTTKFLSTNRVIDRYFDFSSVSKTITSTPSHSFSPIPIINKNNINDNKDNCNNNNQRNLKIKIYDYFKNLNYKLKSFFNKNLDNPKTLPSNSKNDDKNSPTKTTSKQDFKNYLLSFQTSPLLEKKGLDNIDKYRSILDKEHERLISGKMSGKKNIIKPDTKIGKLKFKIIRSFNIYNNRLKSFFLPIRPLGTNEINEIDDCSSSKSAIQSPPSKTINNKPSSPSPTPSAKIRNRLDAIEKYKQYLKNEEENLILELKKQQQQETELNPNYLSSSFAFSPKGFIAVILASLGLSWLSNKIDGGNIENREFREEVKQEFKKVDDLIKDLQTNYATKLWALLLYIYFAVLNNLISRN